MTGSETLLQELATLLARGFIRSLVASRRDPVIALDSGPGGAAATTPNCLDVGGQQSDELAAHKRVGRP
jgi:hypothetical protein